MTRQPVVVEQLPQSVRLSGPGVLAAIEAVRAPRMRDVTRKAWLVSSARSADVIAYVEHVQRRPVIYAQPGLFGALAGSEAVSS